MPNPNPRLLVSISPLQHQLLRNLSQLQGRSMSSYLAALLDHATPALEALEEACVIARARDNPQIDLERYLSRLEEDASGATAPGASSSKAVTGRSES